MQSKMTPPGAEFPSSPSGLTELTSPDVTATDPLIPRRLPLRWNIAWTALGNVIYAACQWGMLMTLAKLGSPEMVGQFALGLAIGAPVMLLANLQLRAIEATDVKHQYQFGDYLSLRLITTLAGLVAICLIALLAGYRRETALVVMLVGVAKSVESVSDVIYGLMQKYERLDRIALAMMLRGVGSLLVFAVSMYFMKSVITATAAMAAWWTTVLVTYEWNAGGKLLKAFGAGGETFAPTWTWPRITRLAWLALPLGLVMVLGSFNTNLPRYFVEHRLGEASLGYFAALAYVMIAGSTIVNALGQSASPRLARHFHNDRGAFIRLVLKMLGVAILVGGGSLGVAATLGKQVLGLLYKPEYAAYSNLFTVLMGAGALTYLSSMLGYSMTAARVFRIQVPLVLSSSLIILAVCHWGFERWGILAAAWSLVASGIWMSVGSAFILSFVLLRTKERTSEPEV